MFEETGVLNCNDGGTSTALGELISHKAYLIDTIKLSIKKDVLTESFLNEKYVSEGLGTSEIARMTFSSRALVTKRLNQYGIKPKVLNRRESGGHVFGHREQCKRSIESRGEQRTIIFIKKQREAGYSYNKIAMQLNDKKIKTKRNVKCWYPKVVRQIYMRAIRSTLH